LLYTILDSSAHVYYVTPKKRKFYLYQLIQEHGIWQDVHIWQELIQESYKFKIDDAIRRKRNRD